MGGSKAAQPLAGRPLIAYPLATLAAVCDRVVVVAKPDTELPPACERWDEPPQPQHPLTGIVHALERAKGAVLCCAADMPFVTAAACRALLKAPTADATVAEADGVLQPVFAVYMPSALDRLRAAPPGAALREVLESLRVTRVPLPADVVRSVDTPEDLAAAERELLRRGTPLPRRAD
jgi:molybdopterin-guanine dinucleotide biosynthesis protein A